MPSHCLNAAMSWVLEEEAPVMGPLTAPGHTVPLAELACVPAGTGTTSLPVPSRWQRWKCHLQWGQKQQQCSNRVPIPKGKLVLP